MITVTMAMTTMMMWCGSDVGGSSSGSGYGVAASLRLFDDNAGEDDENDVVGGFGSGAWGGDGGCIGSGTP